MVSNHAYKSKYIIYAVLFLMVMPALANAAGETVGQEQTTEYNSMAALFQALYQPIIFTLFVIDILIIAILYFYGRTVNEAKILYNTRTEFWQLTLTLVLFLSYASLYVGVEGLFSSLLPTGYPDMNTYIIHEMHSYETYLRGAITASAKDALNYQIEGAALSSIHVMLPYSLPAIIGDAAVEAGWCAAVGLLALPAWGTAFVNCIWSATKNYFGIGSTNNMLTKVLGEKAGGIVSGVLGGFMAKGVTVFFPAHYDKAIYAAMLSDEISSFASFAENTVIPIRIITEFLLSDFIEALLPIAILLRLVPWTRSAGNMLFTLGFSVGIIFPFFTAFFFYSYSSVKGGMLNEFCSMLMGSSTVGSHFVFGPFLDCVGEERPYSAPALAAYYPLLSFGPTLALAIALTFARNFNKLFDYFER